MSVRGSCRSTEHIFNIPKGACACDSQQLSFLPDFRFDGLGDMVWVSEPIVLDWVVQVIHKLDRGGAGMEAEKRDSVKLPFSIAVVQKVPVFAGIPRDPESNFRS
eukprot:439084-Amorphochlora_amoeboformis.AAC.1